MSLSLIPALRARRMRMRAGTAGAIDDHRCCDHEHCTGPRRQPQVQSVVSGSRRVQRDQGPAEGNA